MQRMTPMKLTVLTAIAMSAACSKDKTGTDSAATRRDSAAAATVTRDSAPVATADTAAHNNGWTDGQILGFTSAASAGEITAAQLAEKKATNAGVKAFARQLATDHKAMLAEGESFAKKSNVAVDTTRDVVRDVINSGRDEVKDLTDKAAGADWDKAFLDHEIDDHQKVVDKLQDAAKNTTNADLRAMLVKATGKVQEHLTKAQALKEKYPAAK